MGMTKRSVNVNSADEVTDVTRSGVVLVVDKLLTYYFGTSV